MLQESLGYARRRLDNEREGTRAWRESEAVKTAEDHDDEIPALLDPPSRQSGSVVDERSLEVIENVEFAEFGNTSRFANPGSEYEVENLAERLRDFDF